MTVITKHISPQRKSKKYPNVHGINPQFWARYTLQASNDKETNW